MARVLDAFDVEPLDRILAEIAGEAIAAVRGASAVDAVVMASAARRGDHVVSGDYDDLAALQLVFPTVRVIAV